MHTVWRSPNDVSSPRAPKRSSLTCRELLPKEKSERGLKLFQRYLYDVLLDDLPLWNRDELRGVLAAEPWEGAAPGERERAPKRRLHGLPARNLPPLPRLPFQTLDSLQETKHWRFEVKGSKLKNKTKQQTAGFFFLHAQLWTKVDDCNNTMVRLSGPVSQTIMRLRTNNRTHFCITDTAKISDVIGQEQTFTL